MQLGLAQREFGFRPTPTEREGLEYYHAQFYAAESKGALYGTLGGLAIGGLFCARQKRVGFPVKQVGVGRKTNSRCASPSCTAMNRFFSSSEKLLMMGKLETGGCGGYGAADSLKASSLLRAEMSSTIVLYVIGELSEIEVVVVAVGVRDRWQAGCRWMRWMRVDVDSSVVRPYYTSFL